VTTILLRTRAELRAALEGANRPIGLVPTMGWLHEGHRSLMQRAHAENKTTVVTIFVNPRQFGDPADLEKYPRSEARDLAMCTEEGVGIVFAPGVEEVYPPGFDTTVSVSAIAEPLEGAARPGHFDGVATVVARLFDQVRPDIAVFGEKDYQQLAVIRQLVEAEALPIEIVGIPTQRDADGLALSSRNAYLSEEERTAARALPRALGEAAAAIQAGGDVAEALDRARVRLEAAGFDPIDYVALHDAETLAPMTLLDRPARLLAAARMGRTRLIDNLPVNPA
jgi:pantoate--beta-alanine ligase